MVNEKPVSLPSYGKMEGLNSKHVMLMNYGRTYTSQMYNVAKLLGHSIG